MSYFHPRDFDRNQPIINDLSLFRKFKCYVGINNCNFKFNKWLSDFDFVNIMQANDVIDWDKSEILSL